MAIPEQHKWRYIFHFTDIHNLDSIIKNGLLCPNEKKQKGITHTNIANMTIQERRAKMDVTAGPRGKVHDYVPFYFSSMNPMLLTLLNQKNIDQPLIIYLCLKIDILEKEDAVFTDVSANRNELPNFFDDTTQLDKLDWDLIDSRKWSVETDDAKHKKMAEALIYHSVKIEQIDGIVVYNNQIKEVVERIFKANKKRPPKIMFDHDRCIKNYSFYYTKFYIKGHKYDTLITGPCMLVRQYKKAINDIVAERKKHKTYTYKSIKEIVDVIEKNFGVIQELHDIEGLMQDYPPHNDTVDAHTRRVVEEMKKQDYYQCASNDIKELLLFAAYLHDIGKGPKDKWKNKIITRAYPDHPADAIPMLKRILTEDITSLSDEEIRKICMLVVYHDIVGECMEQGRDIKQIVQIITCEEDLEMLFAISVADTKAINSTWATSIVDRKEYFCYEVIKEWKRP